jgi:hypothetical protein
LPFARDVSRALVVLFQEHTVERILWKWTRRVQKSRKTERVYALIAATCGSSGPIAVRLSTAVSDQIPTPSFPKYPRLPVVQCVGFERKISSSAQNTPDRAIGP